MGEPGGGPRGGVPSQARWESLPRNSTSAGNEYMYSFLLPGVTMAPAFETLPSFHGSPVVWQLSFFCPVHELHRYHLPVLVSEPGGQHERYWSHW